MVSPRRVSRISCTFASWAPLSSFCRRLCLSQRGPSSSAESSPQVSVAVVQEDSAEPAIRASPDLPQTVSYASFLSPSSLSGLSGPYGHGIAIDGNGSGACRRVRVPDCLSLALSAPSALSFPPDPVPFRCIRKVPRHLLLLGGFSLVHRTTVEGDGLRSMHLAKPKRNNMQSISIYILCSNRASKHIECFEIHIETKDMCQRFASTFCAHVASGITMMVVTQADTTQVPERHEGTRHTSQVCP